MTEFIKHYKILLNKAKADLKAALNLHDNIIELKEFLSMKPERKNL